MSDWRRNIVVSDEGIDAILRMTKRIAVLGIKPETESYKPAFYVPRYLVQVGFDVIPVPVYYPDVREILGRPVYRSLQGIPGDVDLIDVFRRAADIPPHVDAIVAKQPKAVWFQLGIRNDEAARQLAEHGILVVQDRCLMTEHMRFGG